jgi:OOP family OmpA-OmpF porin
MLVGAAAGAGGGLVIENNDNEPADRHRTGSAIVGAVAGGTLGYLLCGQPEPPKPAPQPEARPTPPPPPPPAPAPKRIVLRGVNFDFDKSDIRPDAAVILDEAASILNESPGVRVEVSGHTDATGADDYNQGLSERRARSVAEYLSGKGVSADRLDTTGYGESKPVADNATRDGRAQNRRVELNVAQ